MTAQPKFADIKAVLVADLRECRWSREEVAMRLTDMAGRPITEATIDAWTARTKPHRFPADLVPAWVRITGSTRLLHALCEDSGMHAADASDREFAELGRAQIEREKAEQKFQQLKGELWRKA
jgi:hypothetical protein